MTLWLTLLLGAEAGDGRRMPRTALERGALRPE
jgi:hypothetical protein